MTPLPWVILGGLPVSWCIFHPCWHWGMIMLCCTLIHPSPHERRSLYKGAAIPMLLPVVWRLLFLFLLSIDSLLCTLSPWFIHTVSILRRLVILGIPSSTNFPVIHTIGDTHCPNCESMSFILWPHQHPFRGTYSFPSSVSIASLWNATFCFGIIFIGV